MGWTKKLATITSNLEQRRRRDTAELFSSLGIALSNREMTTLSRYLSISMQHENKVVVCLSLMYA